MKTLLAFICLVVMIPLGSVAQEAPDGMVRVAYQELPDDVSEIAIAYENSDKAIRTIHYPMIKKKSDVYIDVNDVSLHRFLEEFYDSANYYKIDYAKELIGLKEVLYVKADDYFIAEVSKDGKYIYLNSKLKAYKYLPRVIFLRQMGKLYGLKEKGKYRHSIMGKHWEIDLEHERFARFLYNRPTQKKEFFEDLEKKRGLRKKI